jgi:hypothetical protein
MGIGMIHSAIMPRPVIMEQALDPVLLCTVQQDRQEHNPVFPPLPRLTHSLEKRQKTLLEKNRNSVSPGQEVA